MSNDFNWFSSKQLGAPQMNGAAGSNGQMLQILDDCLINGFGQQLVSSVTKTATTVTFNYGLTHGYLDKQLLRVSGADDVLLNGNHRIVSKTTNSVTISVSDITLTTGAISTRVAPLGWESVFGSTDPLKRAYRSFNEQGTRTVLYLDMSLPTGNGYNATSPPKRAMVTLCQNMTTLGTPINDYTEIVNNKPAAANGSLFWNQKSLNSKTGAVTSASNSSWVIYGNKDYFIFFNGWQSHVSQDGSDYRSMYGFGDFASAAGDDDRYNCFLFATNSPDDKANIYSSNGGEVSTYTKTFDSALSQDWYTNAGLIIKKTDGSGDVAWFVPSAHAYFSLSSSAFAASGSGIIPYPNPSNNALIVKPIEVMQLNNTMRGIIPRLHYICNYLVDKELDMQVVGEYALIKVASRSNSSVGNSYFSIYLGA